MSRDTNPYESPAEQIVSLPQENLDAYDRPICFVTPSTSATLTLLALGANVLLSLAGVVFNIDALSLYWQAGDLGAVDPDRESTLVSQINLIFAALFLLRLTTAPLLMTWMYRSHRNLLALGHRELDSKPAWVVVCWFVPIMNLFSPCQVMDEIWWRSDPRANATDDQQSSPLLIYSWWGAFLVSIAFVYCSNRLDRAIETASQAATATAFDIAFLVANAIAATLLMAIVGITNRRQLRRYTALPDLEQ